MATGKPLFSRPKDRRVEIARKLRLGMTGPERLLWRGLRKHVLLRHSHFRRQAALGGFIVDFCCSSAQLVIEVDGERHGLDAGRARDHVRDEIFAAQGFKVLRSPNHAVRRGLDDVLETNWAAIHNPDFWNGDATPTPIPSPQGGGGPIGAP